MGLPQKMTPPPTVEEVLSWEGRWELINGVVYDMTPSPNLEHQRISGALFRGLAEVLGGIRKRNGGGGGECEVFFAPLDLFLTSGLFQPDLVVVCDPAKKTARGIEGAPDLVVEILSPGTASKDLSRKRWAYEAAGVPEYLWVDPQEKLAVLLRLDIQGRYQEAARAEWGETLELLGGRISVPIGERRPPEADASETVKA